LRGCGRVSRITVSIELYKAGAPGYLACRRAPQRDRRAPASGRRPRARLAAAAPCQPALAPSPAPKDNLLRSQYVVWAATADYRKGGPLARRQGRQGNPHPCGRTSPCRFLLRTRLPPRSFRLVRRKARGGSLVRRRRSSAVRLDLREEESTSPHCTSQEARTTGRLYFKDQFGTNRGLQGRGLGGEPVVV
jgi:hypothetical protein